RSQDAAAAARHPVVRLAVLLSGRGSNFAAIADAIRRGELAAEIVAVISNRPDAAGIERASALGLPAHVVDHQKFTRQAHEERILEILEMAQPDLIALAGYMRLLSKAFVERYRNRILNIHPSLLPAFPGTDAQAQAIEYGVRVSGCTVHLVDEHLDAGPIVVQRAVEVREDDTAETLAARILVEEHLAYVEALVKLSTLDYRVEGRRVVFGGKRMPNGPSV
ncbi:MAG TPA: phosphoribosylglycinamide formyltransferase, partial [Thermoanaerobaculia bacterium]|nr:phosphoribosylglycinamide formyltransferase [Thermoanaerobaculia bacterium]